MRVPEKYTKSVPPGVQLETAICPVCRSGKHLEHFFDARDRLNGIKGCFGVDLCTACGTYITNPRPDKDNISVYYPESYGPFQPSQENLDKNHSKLTTWIKKKLLNNKQQLTPELEPGKMLEVGCAAGEFMLKMQRQGWSVKGVENSSYAVSRALQSGLDVFEGDLTDFRCDSQYFDLVVGWMVFEHVYDPGESLSRVLELLKPGGTLCISLPNAAALEFQWLKEDSYSVQVPTHLHHFSPENISRLLRRVGFEDVKIFHQVTLLTVLPSIGLYLERRGRFPTLARGLMNYKSAPIWVRAMLYPLSRIIGLLRQSGRMTIWASKPE